MAKNNQVGETIIARGVRIEGEFFAEGDIVIEGEVRGNISTAGDLKIGEDAVIEADIHAQNAVISGRVHGNIKIDARLDLMASSHVSGDINARTLAVEAGSEINGMVHMGEETKKGKKEVEE